MQTLIKVIRAAKVVLCDPCYRTEDHLAARFTEFKFVEKPTGAASSVGLVFDTGGKDVFCYSITDGRTREGFFVTTDPNKPPNHKHILMIWF